MGRDGGCSPSCTGQPITERFSVRAGFHGWKVAGQDTHTHTHMQTRARIHLRRQVSEQREAVSAELAFMFPTLLHLSAARPRTQPAVQKACRWKETEPCACSDEYCCNLLRRDSRRLQHTLTGTFFWQALPYLHTLGSLAQFEQYQ